MLFKIVDIQSFLILMQKVIVSLVFMCCLVAQ